MTNETENRERLRLDLETFLRQTYGLGEGYAAVPEDWDARGVAMMCFEILDGRPGRGVFMRAAPIEDFEAWQREHNGATA